MPRRCLTTIVTLAVAAALAPVPTPASAKTAPEAQDAVDAAQAAYEDAQGEADRLAGEVESVRGRTRQLEGEMPAMRERAAGAMRELYKASPDLPIGVALMMRTTDVDGLVSGMSAVEAISDATIGALVSGAGELASGEERLAGLEAELADAREALGDAGDAVDEAESVLRRILDAPPAIEGCEPIDWSMGDDEIVAEWAPRIDAFFEGYPLEGQGETFVRAGIQYGVDPRFSAAITNTESTKGLYMYVGDYNPWGWMGQSFSSWEEAIYAHTEYLACDYYHARLDAATAQTYCPPTWESWLERTLSYAQSI